jgi:hypothetical protein
VCPDQANAFSLGNTDVTQLADQLCTSDYIAIPGEQQGCQIFIGSIYQKYSK